MEDWEKLTIGQILKKTRESKSISLDEAASSTNISKKFLEYLELDRFEQLPGKIHITGFIRLYGSFLELDEISLMEKLNKQLIMEQETPLDEIMELSKNIKESSKKISPIPFIFVGIILTITVFLFIFLNDSNSKKSSSHNDKPKSIFDQKINLSINETLSIPTENDNIVIKLLQAQKSDPPVVKISINKEKNDLIVKKNEHLKYDYNNDMNFDFEILIDSVKDNVAVFIIKKINEKRLPEQKKLATSLRTDLKSNQFEEKLTIELNNITKYPVLIWLVKNKKEETFKKLYPDKPMQVTLMKSNKLMVKSIEFSDISSIQMKLPNESFDFKKAMGNVGFIEFNVKQGEKNSIVWKANY